GSVDKVIADWAEPDATMTGFSER
ncbi:acylphosphatase, partial [Mycobacteroides abscessus subsp. abscessus]